VKTKAIRFDKTGGPEVLHFEEIDVGEPSAGEARVRHTAIGVNFIDNYHRTGLYPVPLPSGIGLEAAGVVDAVGPGVTQVQVGQRVAYCSGPIGAYSERQNVPAERLVPLPSGISDEQGAAMMLKGMTAEYLLRRTHRVTPGETILFHAAAGGVGLIACQWAKHLGAVVIGTAGSDDKAALARAHGCDHVIVYSREDVAARVREITGGRGVPVVYDAVGQATFDASIDSLSPRGLFVSFGNASGPVKPFPLTLLSLKGSLYLTRPTLTTYTATRDDLLASARALFDVVASGAVKVEVRQRFPLAEAAAAQRALESRQTVGSIVLVP